MKPWTAEHEAELKRITLMYELGLPNPHTGPFEKTKTCAKHQPMCDDCGEFAAQIVWKDDVRNSNTWIIAECEKCDHAFCEDCIKNNDADDGTICYTCYEAEKLK